MQKIFGISRKNKIFHSIKRRPLLNLLIWYLKSRWLLLINARNHLVIGYLTNLSNVKVGSYNTFYNNISVVNSYFDNYIYVGDRARIANACIGKFCSIGPDVKIGLGLHPTNFISTFPAFFSTSRQCQLAFTKKNVFEEVGVVSIGNDVWIGANAIILDNISIGDGAIIGAGAVVTKNVDPYTIVGGVPAKAIKTRFDKKHIEELLEIKWWNFDIDWIKKNYELFNKPSEFFEEIHKIYFRP